MPLNLKSSLLIFVHPGTEDYDSEYSLFYLLTQFWNITLDTLSSTTYKQWCGTFCVKLDGKSAIPFCNQSGLDKLCRLVDKSLRLIQSSLISSNIGTSCHSNCPPPLPISTSQPHPLPRGSVTIDSSRDSISISFHVQPTPHPYSFI